MQGQTGHPLNAPIRQNGREIRHRRMAPPRKSSPMSHCDTIWPASTMSQMSQMSHFCDTRSDTKSCHSVRVSGQLAQCHKCHTFQLQKHDFSYNRCDIVTSA